MATTTNHASWRDDLVLLCVALIIFGAYHLGLRPYLNPSEARYVEIPRQMLATQDWLTPRINGVPYFEKPPLFFWLQASIMHLLGTGEFASRFASVLLSTLTCLITYATARHCYNRRAGQLSAAILATSLMGFTLTRMPGLDLPLTCFTTLTLACYIRKHYRAMAAATALAVLTKGLVGAALPALIVCAHLTLTRNWREALRMRLLSGSIIFLLIAAPWHILMQQAHPGFFNFYFLHEHFDRFVSDTHHRLAPWWFFTAVTLLGLIPWLPLLPGALRLLRPKTNSNDLLLLLWIMLPLLFFSCSHSKLTGYIFPIFPPLAILLANKAEKLWTGTFPIRSLRYDCLFILFLLAASVCACYALPTFPGKAGKTIALLNPPPIGALLPLILTTLTLITVLISRSAAPAHLLALMALGAGLGLTLNETAAALDTTGTKPLAGILKPMLRDDTEVVAFETYWQDLPIYLNRNITIAGYTGELGYGASLAPQETIITTDAFWSHCANTPHAVYVFMLQTRFNNLAMPSTCHLTPIASFGPTLLLQKTP